ncbi:MAG: hypothetical protein GY855_01555 [candidate division Zixibacteria bacterium]|nr:hypothetical protein [candidate division Zixibacteria bacterium]
MMSNKVEIKDLSRETLEGMLGDFARNWLAHDGLWFLKAEADAGMEKAILYDKQAWQDFTQIEAKRIMKRHNIQPDGGLEALEKALWLRMYAFINKQSTYVENDRLILEMNDCRVQSARERNNRDLFPCKEVGIIEYEYFAKTIDSRIKTECKHCPPDEHHSDYFCKWEFTLKE